MTVLTSINNTLTQRETFYATTLPEYTALTVSTPTTMTTTDAAGQTIVAVVFAGGIAWLAAPWPGGPALPLPIEAPNMPPTVSLSEPTDAPKSSSSDAHPTETQSLIADPAPNKIKSALDQVPIRYDDNDIACVTPAGDKPEVQRDRASGIIDKFCMDMANRTARPGLPIERVLSLGAGVNLNISVSANSMCSADFDSWTIDQGDCDYFLGEALDGCQTNDLLKSGGTIQDACIKWALQLEQNNGDLVCVDQALGTGVNRDEALDAIHHFCSKFAQSESTPDIHNSQTYKQLLGDSEMVLSVAYSTEHICAQNGDEARYVIEETSCERFMRRNIDDCNTAFSTSTGKYGGNVSDACAVFSLSTQVNEKTLCGGKKGIPTMQRKDAIAAIDQYCNKDQVLDPTFNRGNHFYQNPPKGASWDTYLADEYAIQMEANFGDLGYQEGCEPGRKFSTKGNECKRKLTTVINQCSLSDGGQLSDNTLNGCVLWSIYSART